MLNTPYSFNLAIQSLWREKWVNLLAILTITAGLLINSLAFFSLYNLDLATKRLPEHFTVVLYLDDNVSQKQRGALMQTIEKNDAVNSMRYISKQDAMDELKSMLRSSEYLFEGLGENPLPESLEITLKKEAVGPETVNKFADEIQKLNGVDEIVYGDTVLATIHSLRVGFKTLGTVLIGILSVGIIFVCYSTVKILFYRKNEEIETFKLLGATSGFIKTPFLIEGAIIGAGGGILSLVGMLSFYYLVLLKFSLKIPLFKALLFPTKLFLWLPLLGVFLGITGAMIALGRLKY